LETGQQGVQLTPYGDYTIEDVVTFLVDDLYEAANAAQQAAIAIAMKKAGKKPKHMSEQQVDEKWSQKYKSSINCSHPRGFSQRAHCAGKKKHNESVEMEMVCPDCGMCETHGDHSRNTLDEDVSEAYPYVNPEAVRKQKEWRQSSASDSDDNVKTFAYQGYTIKFKPDVVEVWLGGDKLYSKSGSYANPTKVQLVGARLAVGKIIASKQQQERLAQVAQLAKSKQGVAEEKVRLDPKCWTGKHIGNPATKVKGGVRVNNCVPNESMDEDYNKGMKMADYVAQADRLHDEMMRCQHENDQTGYERAKQAYLELERQARQGIIPETAGTTAATMPPSPAAAAQAKAIVQKAADDRAISLANMARVVPNNVAEGKVINTYLWHGSRQKIPMLEPRQSVDTGGAAGSNQNAIYATSDPKVAIAMGLTTAGSDTGMFPNDPQMVLFSGKIRKGEHVYLHKLPFKGPDGKPQFVQGGNSREFHSIPGVEGIKPIEIKEIPVNKYLNLIRKATPADLKLRKKYMRKQGVAEATGDAGFDKMMGKIQDPEAAKTNLALGKGLYGIAHNANDAKEKAFFRYGDEMLERLEHVARRMHEDPVIEKKYKTALENQDFDAVWNYMCRALGTTHDELFTLEEILQDESDSLINFLWHYIEGHFAENYLIPWQKYKQSFANLDEQGVAESSGAWPFADVNEVSDATLASYKQKAHKSAEQLSAAGQHRAATDRYGNIMKATGKQIDRTTKNIARALAKK
jgi:hypothetical protein